MIASKDTNEGENDRETGKSLGRVNEFGRNKIGKRHRCFGSGKGDKMDDDR